jgi:hypothetical protein
MLRRSIGYAASALAAGGCTSVERGRAGDL